MRKILPLKEYVKIYEKKTNDKFKLPKGFKIYYLADRGFCEFKADKENNTVMVYQMCGDILFWRDIGELLACQNNLKYLSTICTVHIKPYLRLLGFKIVKEFFKNGQYRFICKDKLGRKVIATHKHFDDKTGEPAYWVTQYLNELLKGEDVENV